MVVLAGLMIRKRKQNPTSSADKDALEMKQPPIPGHPDDDIEIKYLEEDEIAESKMTPTED